VRPSPQPSLAPASCVPCTDEYVYGYEDYIEDPLTEDAGGVATTGDKKEDKKAPSASGASSGTPANGTVKQRLTRSKRVKKPTFSNKEVEFAPAAEVKFGDDIDDEGTELFLGATVPRTTLRLASACVESDA